MRNNSSVSRLLGGIWQEPISLTPPWLSDAHILCVRNITMCQSLVQSIHDICKRKPQAFSFPTGTGNESLLDHSINCFWETRYVLKPVNIEKAREFKKNIYLCFIDYRWAFGCVDHNKLWKILQEMGIPYHITCLLRNLYADQEVTVRTGHGTLDLFQIWKGVHQGCMLSPYF